MSDITEAEQATAVPAETTPYVPTLREQIESHLWRAHKAKDPDTALMHLAIAAGVGLASTTLDDLEFIDSLEAEEHRIPLTPSGIFGGITIDRGPCS